MIRIKQYQSANRPIQAGNIDPGFVQPLVNRVGQDAASTTMQSLLDSGKQLTDVAIKDYVSSETARVSQSLLAMKTDMAAERDRYMQEHQGEKALDAGTHFEQFARQTAQKYMEEGGFSGKFAQMFQQQAAMTALSFTETGQAYGRQQKQAWQDSVLKGDTESYLADAARHYNDPEWLEANRPAIQERINNLRPGMDNRALFAQLDQQAAASTIEGYLANNNVGGARAWLQQNGAMGGEKLNGLLDKVNARGRELEARARAEAERARAENAIRGVQGLLQNTAGLPLEERQEKILAAVEAQPDLRDRAAMRQIAISELQFQDTLQKSQVASQARALVKESTTQNLSPIAAAQFFAANGQSQDVVEYATKLAFGQRQETPDSRRALREALIRVDMNEMADAPTREAFAMNHGLTLAQTNTLLDYKGKAADIPISKVQTVYKALGGGDALPDGFYDSVLQSLAPGKKPSAKELNDTVANLLMDGERQGGGFGYGRDMNLFNAGQQGRTQTWLPNISDNEAQKLDAALTANNLKPTDFNRRKLKKLNMGLAESRPWE